MPRLVTVTPEAYQIMLLHAFSHEREEIGGVLVGQADEKQTFVITVIPLKRASHETEGEAVHRQQRSSRVHVTDVELAECIPRCEEIAEQLKAGKKNMGDVNIVGWYHSHPHITPFPSAVDIQTQFRFQRMGSNFIGLIFSVFVRQAHSPTQAVSLLGFQSATDKTERRLKVCVQPYPSTSSNFYQVSGKNWQLVSGCIVNECLSEAEAFVPMAKKSSTDYIKFKGLLTITEGVVDSISNTMVTFVKYLKLGLNMIANAKNSP